MDYVMQLYYSPGACSLASHITLREAGLPVDLRKADTKTKKLEDGSDYFAVNSKGAVPALRLDDGQILTEGPAILQYLADQKPESKLAPKAGTLERYRLLEWLNFITSEVHKSFSPLFNPAADPAVKQYTTQNLEKKFDWINKQLAGKQYLTGDQFTIADAYLFVVANWSNFVGIDLGRWPALKAFQDRVAARPKVQEALAAEGLLQKAA
ncbi:MAG TPA: glutathione transferase GstA [Steroidobacteraceae bacterium]|jgi:glutathione S-transferase|nr:glutathione transferase GstA [Steroidobacteraceae bacterium]